MSDSFNLILLKYNSQDRTAITLCPVCNRISIRRIAENSVQENSQKLLRAVPCPVCKTRYTHCRYSASKKYVKYLDQYKLAPYNYNKEVKTEFEIRKSKKLYYSFSIGDTPDLYSLIISLIHVLEKVKEQKIAQQCQAITEEQISQRAKSGASEESFFCI